MKLINIISLYVFCSFFVSPCLANDSNIGSVSQQNIVNSIKTPEMKSTLELALVSVDNAQKEIEDFRNRVASGDIPIENNNGIWCAVFDESDTVTKVGHFSSPTGPLTYFMKRVYSDMNHSGYLNTKGYHMEIYPNGVLKLFMRADLQEMSEFYPSGKIKAYSITTENGSYLANWDENSGQLHKESGSMVAIPRTTGLTEQAISP